MTWKLYDQLGLSKGASKEDIKRAYKKRALETHPDRGGDPELFKQINHAYTILSSDDTRTRYDQTGDEGYDAAGGGVHINPHDIFQQFFGGAFNFHGMPQQPQVPKRNNHRHLFKIDMMEAYFGAKKGMRVILQKTCTKCHDRCYGCQGRGQVTEMRRMGIFTQMATGPCARCHGSGMMKSAKADCHDCKGAGNYNQEHIIDVIIPAGVETGHTVVYDGMGEQPVRPDELPGDLHIELFVHPHERLTRQGNDLHIRIPLSLCESIVGARVSIPHFAGEFHINTTELGVVQPTKQYVIKNKGMPIMGRDGHGNMIAQFDIQYPNKKLSPEEASKIRDALTEVGLA